MTEFPDLCRQCGGKCCKRPYMTNDEYIRLVLAIGQRAARAAGPVHLDPGWRFSAESCPGLTETGCILPYEKRPLTCRIYPFIPVPTLDQGLAPLLAVQTCPYWDVFGGGVEDVKKELNNGS